MTQTPTTTPDRPRRRRFSLAESQELVAAWQASGQRKDAWCRQRALPRSALYACLRRVAAAVGHPTNSAAAFIELHPPRSQHLPRPLRLTLGAAGAIIDLSIDDLLAVIQRMDGSQS